MDVPKDSLSEVSQTWRISSLLPYLQEQPRVLKFRDKKQSSSFRGWRGRNGKLCLGFSYAGGKEFKISDVGCPHCESL